MERAGLSCVNTSKKNKVTEATHINGNLTLIMLINKATISQRTHPPGNYQKKKMWELDSINETPAFCWIELTLLTSQNCRKRNCHNLQAGHVQIFISESRHYPLKLHENAVHNSAICHHLPETDLKIRLPVAWQVFHKIIIDKSSTDVWPSPFYTTMKSIIITLIFTQY